MSCVSILTASRFPGTVENMLPMSNLTVAGRKNKDIFRTGGDSCQTGLTTVSRPSENSIFLGIGPENWAFELGF